MGLVSIHAEKVGESDEVGNVPGRRSKNSKYTVADIDRLYQTSPVRTTQSSPLSQQTLEEEAISRDIPMLDFEDGDVEQVSHFAIDSVINHDDLNLMNGEMSKFGDSKEEFVSTSLVMGPTRLKTIFVIDTNFIISYLNTLEVLRTLASRFHHQIVIPSTVMQELDGLKAPSHDVTMTDEWGSRRQVSQLARTANDWIYRNLANLESGIMGQKLRQTINPNRIKDDAILDCCLYFKDVLGCFVILMSNDKNLCLKALTEQVLTVSFRKGMSAQLIATKAYEENIFRFGADSLQQNTYASPRSTLQFHELMSTIYNEVHDKMVDAVDYAIRREYGEELELINYRKDDLSNLRKISLVIAQFWISVFGQLFRNSKIRQSDWRELPDSVLEVPRVSSELALFTGFWKDTLNILFVNRSEQELKQLDLLTSRWTDLANQYKNS